MSVSMFFLLLKKHFKLFLKDFKAYSLVNQTACEITEPMENSYEYKVVKEIRKIASENYNPNFEELKKENKDATL